MYIANPMCQETTQTHSISPSPPHTYTLINCPARGPRNSSIRSSTNFRQFMLQYCLSTSVHPNVPILCLYFADSLLPLIENLAAARTLLPHKEEGAGCYCCACASFDFNFPCTPASFSTPNLIPPL